MTVDMSIGALSRVGTLLAMERSERQRDSGWIAAITVRLERWLTMQHCTFLHRQSAVNRRNLHQRLGIIVRVENGEFVREDGEHHDTRRPDINC